MRFSQFERHVHSKICQYDQKHTLFSNFARFCTPKRCTRVHCLVLKNNPNYVNFFTRMISNFRYKWPPQELPNLCGIFTKLKPKPENLFVSIIDIVLLCHHVVLYFSYTKIVYVFLVPALCNLRKRRFINSCIIIIINNTLTENAKKKKKKSYFCDFRLILLDRITYASLVYAIQQDIVCGILILTFIWWMFWI